MVTEGPLDPPDPGCAKVGDHAVNSKPSLVYRPGVRWDDVQGTDRHLVERLADQTRVLWVDPPLSLARASSGPMTLSRRSGQLTQVADNVWRSVTLAPPFPDRRLTRPVSAMLLRRSVSAALAVLGWTPAALVVSSPQPQSGLVRDVPYVYYATDDFVAGADLLRTSPAVMHDAEQGQLRVANALVSVSPVLLHRWGEDNRPRLLLPNGCDVDAYASVDTSPLPADVALPAPVAGVVGQLSGRLDLDLLEAVAAAGISLLLVGPTGRGLDAGRFRTLVDLPNVQWVGQKAYSELTSYLHVIDVGLTPYADTAFNRASFPLKTLEYLAAGRAVVSTPLPAVDDLATPLISTASTPEGFVLATRALLAQPRTHTSAAARRAFAAQHSWASRAETLWRFIESLAAR